MASVHRRERSPFWTIAYTDARGRRVKKSSKSKDRGDALRLALQLERAARLARRGALFENRARGLLSELLGQVSHGISSVREPSIGAFLDAWVTGRAALVSPSTASSLRTAIKGLNEHLKSRVDRPLTTLQQGDLQDWVGTLRTSGLSAGTIKLRMKIIRRALNSAVQQQLLTSNPAELVELPRGFGVERGTFTPAEVGILVQAAPDEWKLAIMLGFYTGARLGDIANLKWTDVDLAKATVTYRQKKLRGKPVTVPIYHAVLARLEALASNDTPQTFVMPGLAGRDTGGRPGLSNEFKAICSNAGLELGQAENCSRNKISKRSYHALRHSFATHLLNLGVDEGVRMALCGHTSTGSHRRYAHATPATLAAAVQKLPGIPEVAS